MQKTKDIGKYAGIACGIGLLLISVSFAFGQGTTGNLSATPTKKQLEAMELRKTQALQNLATSTIKQKLETVQNRVKATAENLEKVRNEAQTKVLQTREKIQSKLMEIQNQQKQKLAEQIADQFDHINEVWTGHFTNVLNRLEAILEKIKNRADKAATNAQDVSEVDADIKKAETAILTARAAVETQAKKTYAMDLTAVNSGIATTTTAMGQNKLIINLRAQFKTLRDQLREDLFELRDGAIKDSRTAVQDALQALSDVPSVDEEPTATSTPSS